MSSQLVSGSYEPTSDGTMIDEVTVRDFAILSYG